MYKTDTSYFKFIIRGYETHSMPRKERSKGGVIILTRLGLAAKEFQINTDNQSEIHGILYHQTSKYLKIFEAECDFNDSGDFECEIINPANIRNEYIKMISNH